MGVNGYTASEEKPGLPSVWRLVLDLLRSAGACALAAGGASAGVMSLWRALCLPPYWPRGMPFGCGHGALPAALLRATLETVLSTLHLALPGLLAGVAVHVAVRGVARSPFRAWTAVFGGIVGAAVWVWLLMWLEASYIDALVGWPALLAGGAAAGAVGAWVVPRRGGDGGVR